MQLRTGSTLALFTLLAVTFLQFPIETLADETKVETFIGTWEGVQIGRDGNPVEAVYTFRAGNGGLAGESSYHNRRAATRANGVLSDIRVKGNAIKFFVTYQGGLARGTTAMYELELKDNDTLKGTGANPISGSIFDVTLKRK
jgi:hypothetical protein